MGECLSSLRLRRRETATTSQTGAPPPPRPTLLGIDAAICARIYEYSIINDEPMYVRPQEQSHQPALARVSRQLREEVLPRFYSGNDFVLAVPRSWIKRYIAWPDREPEGFDRTYPRLTIGRGL
jgi:hypothetical protein